MKANWFRIKNFKSIEDSGICYLNKEITVIAGKNESGKSTIFEALKAFDEQEFLEEHYTASEISPVSPSVTVDFSLTLEEFEAILRDLWELENEYEFEFKNKLDSILNIEVTKNKETINCNGGFNDYLKKYQEVELNYWAKRIEDELNGKSNGNKFEIIVVDYQEIEGLKEQIDDFIENEIKGDITEKFTESLYEYLETFRVIQTPVIFERKLEKHLPNFILFNSFEDILPNEVEEDEVSQSNIVKRFFNLIELSPETIFNEKSAPRRKRLVNTTSTKLNGDFVGYYKQNEVKLKVDVDGDKIQFYIYDENPDIPYHPDQRSKGFQWFLSFYITLKSECQTGKSIILIDEPGLYLHAKAQNDLLKLLESLSIDNQILFSTHSPYLIDASRLDRLRLVIKDNSKTFIENKFHKIADKDTLTPIITAIGFDLTQGLGFDKKLNIICEGISDYYYVLGMFRVIKPSKELNFSVIPAVGVDQIPNLISILTGWGIRAIALMDYDAQSKGVAQKLKASFNYEEDKDIVFISKNNNYAIEDLFSKADFIKYVLQEDIKDMKAKSNSKVASEQSKALLARRFFDLVMTEENIKFSSETLDNFNKLIEVIEKSETKSLQHT